MKKKVEILAPAGSYEVFLAVMNAGADAVYLAGNMFGARAYAGNLSNEELIKAIEYCKFHDKKMYLTVNTLLKNNEINNELYDYLLPLYNAGLDGVIVQDYGVMKFIHEAFPDMEIHASTQMTITDSGYADFLKNYNVTRIVPARELSLEEIRHIHDNTGMEIECFVHGSLCYCYSGLCLMSSFIGGRSGNRGRCAQTCRLDFNYNGRVSKILSLKDLCTLDILPEIIEAGVFSFKIEGRMKSAEYAAGVTSIYRKYVDMYLNKGKDAYKVDKKDRDRILMLFDRGGQTDGYYKKHNGREMIAKDSKLAKDLGEKKQYEEYIHKTYVETNSKIKINGTVTIKKNNPVTMSLTLGDIVITAEGPVAEAALNRAVTEEDVDKQLRKMGQTMFELDMLDIRMEDNIFIPLKNLNELRRTAVDKLTEAYLEASKRNNSHRLLPDKAHTESFNKGVSVHVLTYEQADEAVKHNIQRMVIDTEVMSEEEINRCVDLCRKNNVRPYIGMPRVDRGTYSVKGNPDGYMIRSVSQKPKCNKEVIADYCIYAFNNYAVSTLKDYGITGITYPLELNEKELSGMDIDNGELVVYGRIPLMVTANCIDKTSGNCHKGNTLFSTLRDRKNALLPVLTCCKYCYNIIYNSVPVYLFDKLDKIKIQPEYYGIIFTTENAAEVADVFKSFDNRTKPEDNTFTRGHFTRGVE